MIYGQKKNCQDNGNLKKKVEFYYKCLVCQNSIFDLIRKLIQSLYIELYRDPVLIITAANWNMVVWRKMRLKLN